MQQSGTVVQHSSYDVDQNQRTRAGLSVTRPGIISGSEFDERVGRNVPALDSNSIDVFSNCFHNHNLRCSHPRMLLSHRIHNHDEARSWSGYDDQQNDTNPYLFFHRIDARSMRLITFPGHKNN